MESEFGISEFIDLQKGNPHQSALRYLRWIHDRVLENPCYKSSHPNDLSLIIPLILLEDAVWFRGSRLGLS